MGEKLTLQNVPAGYSLMEVEGRLGIGRHDETGEIEWLCSVAASQGIEALRPLVPLFTEDDQAGLSVPLLAKKDD